MKYIITESQYKIIVEGNKRIKMFQELVNRELKNLQDICNEDEDILFCFGIDSIENIIVTDVEYMSSEHNPKVILSINIMYEYLKYKDYSDFIYELQYFIRKSTGLPIDIKYEEVNLKTNPQW
jgi:hypothetical protein